ncbi:MAG TPA: class I SAM-dependent methyltransferase [Acidobacteriota bacterium]|nr:class I SAM-dependent methyltransferase [Acidobacteriota bacterium]
MGFPKLYGELASWWPLLSAPEEYAEEAEIYRRALMQGRELPPRSLLELGSGGGNNASHMKAHFDITLVDLSPGMLEVSRALNPECEHVEGDMRTVRLGRQFDAVFIHDAVDHMATADDLLAALRTAFAHCAPGGVALVCPDHVRETFRPSTGHGGHDGVDRALRYLEWTSDPDPGDSCYTHDMAYMLRSADGSVRVEYDRALCGLFARAEWLEMFADVGFEGVTVLPFEHSEVEPEVHEMYRATR